MKKKTLSLSFIVINLNKQPKDDHLIFPTKCRADEQEGEGVEQKSEILVVFLGNWGYNPTYRSYNSI